ncbi:tetratricopeptide repeat protein [Mariprofundus ferrooxydans]|nr:tetratricopeptide repeat protein [Mariprofundus ferrooxydans]
MSPCLSMAASSDRVQTARIFLANGNPDQAVRTAEKLLKKQNLSRDEQRELLRLIADAEYMRTTHQHFQQVDIAIQSIDALLHEFPALPQAAQYRWNRAWLWQQSGNNKQAMTTLREIIAKDQQPGNLRRAWLMMARIHIGQRHYAYARSDLLQYGLQVNEKSREQAVGMAWMAIVDKGEGRSDASYTNLATVFRHWPAVVSDQPLLYSTYIKLLRERNHNDQALHLSEDFIRRYIDTELAADIRLIHADIISEKETNIPAAIKEYGILADSQAETGVGRRAFMRKLMLENRHESQRDKLLPVMVALKKVADSNQLSKLEDEAMLDLARLWTRISSPVHNNTGHAPALEAYAHAAISTDQRIAKAANSEGARWLQSKLNTQLEAGHWLETVTIWRKYPQLQPAAGKAPDLEFSVAHAMRMLMLFDAAEDMLQNLYARNKTSIRGQKIMVEMAKLWMDRQDNDGVKKIMSWINRNPLSIYRPEMILIIARIRMNQKQPELARQMLSGVSADALATESRASFWLTKAEIAAAMKEWHTAARNWKQYRKSSGADQVQGLLNEADALFTASEFAEAYKQFMQIPDERRDAAWQYYVGRCQLNTGAVKQGTERLQGLAADKGAGRFATLAKLELANQQAGSLLGAKP